VSKAKYMVLIADDSTEDVFFLTRAIESAAPRLRVVGTVRDGQEIVEYLTGGGRFADREKHPVPDLLVMDWRMPRRDGYETLEWLQAHPIPQLKVAVLADSSGTAHREEVLKMGANCFLSKAMDPGALIHAAKCLQAECLKPEPGQA
jgi:CheY-like chemotaxis protein